MWPAARVQWSKRYCKLTRQNSRWGSDRTSCDSLNCRGPGKMVVVGGPLEFLLTSRQTPRLTSHPTPSTATVPDEIRRSATRESLVLLRWRGGRLNWKICLSEESRTLRADSVSTSKSSFTWKSVRYLSTPVLCSGAPGTMSQRAGSWELLDADGGAGWRGRDQSPAPAKMSFNLRHLDTHHKHTYSTTFPICSFY